MSKDLNQCNFIGRLGKDPEQRFMTNGKGVTSFSIAVGDDYKDSNGAKVEQTEWIRCVAFGAISDVVAKYVQKGSRIFISGKFKTRTWDKDGVTQYSTEINVNEMQMLDSRTQEPAGQQGATSKQYSQASGGTTQQAPQQQAQNFDSFDDDPF